MLAQYSEALMKNDTTSVLYACAISADCQRFLSGREIVGEENPWCFERDQTDGRARAAWSRRCRAEPGANAARSKKLRIHLRPAVLCTVQYSMRSDGSSDGQHCAGRIIYYQRARQK